MNKKKRTKSEKFRDIVFWLVRIQSVALIVYGIIGLALNLNGKEANSKYIFMFVQAGSLAILTFVPWLCNKVFKVQLPLAVEILYLLFTTCCLLLGEIFDFYVKFDWWDDLLHTFSGSFITVLGFIIIYFLNEKKDIPMKLSPGFIILFCFCFAMAVEAVWEIFEYTVDGIVNTNMQRYKDNYDNTTLFQGRAALADTMGDIIETVMGSLIFCTIGFIDMKCKHSRLQRLLSNDRQAPAIMTLEIKEENKQNNKPDNETEKR